jgi:spermidine/putrescine transport system substrate-binding protein
MKTINKLFAVLLITVLAVSAFGCGKDDDDAGTLNIFTWAEYVPTEIVRQFEQDTGIRVNYSTFSSDNEMYEKYSRAGGVGYDIIICGDFVIETMIEEGLLQKIDWSRVDNAMNINRHYQYQYYDPNNEYTVPYASGGAILVYDPTRVPFEITSFDDLWDDRLRNSVVILDEDRTVLGMALLTMGHSVNTTNPQEISEMSDVLRQLRPNIVGFDSNTPHYMMISGEATVGFMYGSQITAAMNENANLVPVHPSEGIIFFIDNLVVSAHSPNLDNVYTFINYILQPEISARISMITNYANCTNTPASYFSEEFKNNMTVNLPDHILERSEMIRNIGETELEYGRIWTEFQIR